MELGGPLNYSEGESLRVALGRRQAVSKGIIITIIQSGDLTGQKTSKIKRISPEL